MSTLKRKECENGMLFAVMALVVAILVITDFPCQGANNVIYGCYQKNNGQLRIVEKPSECRASEIPISWNQVGPPGPRGPQALKAQVACLRVFQYWVIQIPHPMVTLIPGGRLSFQAKSGLPRQTCRPPGMPL